MGWRKCIKCGATKPAADFWFHHGNVNRGSCKACYLANRAEWRRRGGEPNRSRRYRGRLCESHEECKSIVRSEIYRRNKGKCGICGDLVDEVWHIDHIIPLSKDGKHCYSNVQPSHPECNLLKGDTILVE